MPVSAAAKQSSQGTRPLGLRKKLAYLGVAVLLLAAVMVLPLFLSNYIVRLLTSIFMFVALAQSLNIIAGFAGRADFGNVVYFGIGGYATGLLFTNGVPIPLAIAAGALLSASVATLIGFPVLRLKGHYFAIATIGIMEGTRQLVTNMDVLGGGAGMSLATLGIDPGAFAAIFYFAMLGLAIAYTLLVYALSRSSLGYGLRALKADEEAAQVMGINTTLAKTSAWALSAACTAVVGGVYALWFGFIVPETMFNIIMGAEYFIMMLVGGVGTVLGPVVGAVLIQVLQVVTWSNFQHGHMAVLGVVIVLVVVFMPAGIVPTVREKFLR